MYIQWSWCTRRVVRLVNFRRGKGLEDTLGATSAELVVHTLNPALMSWPHVIQPTSECEGDCLDARMGRRKKWASFCHIIISFSHHLVFFQCLLTATHLFDEFWHFPSSPWDMSKTRLASCLECTNHQVLEIRAPTWSYSLWTVMGERGGLVSAALGLLVGTT